LKFYGISGKDYALYKSCLDNRYQQTTLQNEIGISNKVSNWATVKYGVPQGSVVGTLFFLIYVNDLPRIVNNKSVPMLFAHNTSILFAHSHITDFNNNIPIVFEVLNKWFKGHLVSLNFNKIHFTQFTTKRSHTMDLKIVYDNRLSPNISHTKFLGINIDSTLSWSNHIEY
jgi:hypothetical protein